MEGEVTPLAPIDLPHIGSEAIHTGGGRGGVSRGSLHPTWMYASLLLLRCISHIGRRVVDNPVLHRRRKTSPISYRPGVSSANESRLNRLFLRMSVKVSTGHPLHAPLYRDRRLLQRVEPRSSFAVPPWNSSIRSRALE